MKLNEHTLMCVILLFLMLHMHFFFLSVTLFECETERKGGGCNVIIGCALHQAHHSCAKTKCASVYHVLNCLMKGRYIEREYMYGFN